MDIWADDFHVFCGRRALEVYWVVNVDFYRQVIYLAVNFGNVMKIVEVVDDPLAHALHFHRRVVSLVHEGYQAATSIYAFARSNLRRVKAGRPAMVGPVTVVPIFLPR